MNARILVTLCLAAGLAAAGCDTPRDEVEEEIAQIQEELGYNNGYNTGYNNGYNSGLYQADSPLNGGSNSLHLEATLRFPTIRPGSDAATGQALFGLAADKETIDSTQGLFEGQSIAFGGEVQSNGRTCSTCHRGESESFGMPALPISSSVSLTDPLFTGIDADAGGDPDAMTNLDQLGLFKYRPNRFNLARTANDPYRRVFFWRKSPALVNLVFNSGFLNDGRGRTLFEAARGAIFSHTQNSDDRFDDLIPLQNVRDMEAFLFSQLSDPALAPLLDKNDPMHHTLATQPFYTVNLTTWQQVKGRSVFIRDCMNCHNTPNVFSNRWNVMAIGSDPDRSPDTPPFGPNTGRNFNVGVAERNAHQLRLTEHMPNGFQPIVVPLVNEDGTLNQHTVTTDLGLAATTCRTEDIGRFKVPQLRNIKNLGPYFHDNSAATLEDVIAYFNSNHYNYSKDGKRNPIHESYNERKWLLAFLNAL